MAISALFKHQKQSIKILSTKPEVFDMSDPGCVDSMTEYLTPNGWKHIDKYNGTDLVAQFHPNSKTIEFVKPSEYIKLPCNQMIAIEPTRGTSQLLSPEHRVLHYGQEKKSWDVCSAEEYMNSVHKHGPSHFNRKFCTTYSVINNTMLDFTDTQLRVQIAVAADGSFAGKTNKCVIRVKKERKKQRLHDLLSAAGIHYVCKACGGKDPDFIEFRFEAPTRDKTFDERWWAASQHQLEIIADELQYWDSAQDPRPSKGTRFSTFDKTTADFAQYAFSAAKRTTSITVNIRYRDDRKDMTEWIVHARSNDELVGPGRKSAITIKPSTDGFKYCFTVSSSYLLLRRNGYIFATGNTGKTRVEIEDITAKLKMRNAGKVLIFAPKSLLQSAWGDDFNKFAPGVKYVVATAANRLDAFSKDVDVYITNHDAIAALAKQPPTFWKRFKGGILIIDESSAFKHRTSKRSSAMAKAARNFTHRRLMSGTPNANGVCDLWHQMYIIDSGKRLGKSFFAFRSAVCTPTQVGPRPDMLKWEDKPNAEAMVSALIADVVIRHKFEECTDIPPNHQYSTMFDLNKKHMATYKQLENDTMLFLKNDEVINAVNGASLYTKLLQTASGAVYNESGDYSLIDSDRYELVSDLVEARDHSIVFFLWQHQRDELMKEAEKRGISFALIDGTVTRKGHREQIVDSYQRGFYQLLLAHPQSAGHGLTLTKGTRTIFASPTPNLEHYLQGLKRIHRIGQREKTETITIVARGTIEEEVYERLQAKDARMTNLFNYLKTRKAA